MLPNFLIIGAQKCGTTSLHYYLNRHPDIFMSSLKEVDFFSEGWAKGTKWYESHFPEEMNRIGESSPSYTFYPVYREVPERICSVLGRDAKLIYLVRDPLERIRSQYVHDLAMGRYNSDIETVLRDEVLLERYNYVNTSKYYLQLERFLEFFPESNILIMTQEDLQNSRLESIREVLRFLNVDDSFRSPEFDTVVHSSGSKVHWKGVGRVLFSNAVKWRKNVFFKKAITSPVARFGKSFLIKRYGAIKKPFMGEELKRELIDQLIDDTNRLREFTGRDFDEWCL